MKKEKKSYRIPRSFAVRGAWACAGGITGLFFIGMFYQKEVLQTPVFLLLTILCWGGLALFAGVGNWVNATQQGVIYGHKKLLNLRSAAWPTYHFYGGTPKQYLEYFDPNIGGTEFIALVAWRHKNGNIYAVERPGRHGHVTFMLAEMDMAGSENLLDDGFVTSHGRYVNRKEALIIASATGQMIRNTGPVNELFSEDLWYTPKESRSPAYDQDKLDKDDPRAMVLTTLPSLEYLSNPDIQITKEELDALAGSKSAGFIAQRVDSVIPDVVIDAAIASVKTLDEEEEPIPETGILTQTQAVRLYNKAHAEFFEELDVELMHGNRFIAEEVRNMVRHRDRFLDVNEGPRWRLEYVLDDLMALAAAARQLREAKLARLMYYADDQLLIRSSQLRNAARVVAGKTPIATGEWILKGAERLIGMACEEGVVLTIELQQRDPKNPAIGRYYMVPEVREAFGSYAPRLMLERELKEQARATVQ